MLSSRKKSRPKEKAPKNISAIIPIKDRQQNHFVLKDGSVIDIFRITTHDLDSLSPTDRGHMIMDWTRFYQSYGEDIKIIAMNFPTNTKKQQQYFKYKIDRNHSPVFDRFLKEKLSRLEDIEKYQIDRHYYMMTFHKNEDAWMNDQMIIQSRLGRNGLIEREIDFEEKLSVLKKLANKNDVDRLFEFHSMTVDERLQDLETKKRGYNPFLLADIQPSGGINFNVERYSRTGAGYEGCVTIHRYPQKVGVYWLIRLLSLSNTVVTLDIHTPNIEETKRNINDSISENERRRRNEKDLTARDTADETIYELREYFQEIERQGQVNKQITTRIFLFDNKFQDLDTSVSEVLERLRTDAYEGCVFVNEAQSDWMSMYQSYTTQSKTRYAREGQSILSGTIAKGLPFYFTSVDDETGAYMGATNSGHGPVLWDIFTKSKSRLSYDLIAMGVKGSGKSTTMKKLILDNAIRGNYFRIIDPSGEFDDLVIALGGHIISLDGTKGMLNALDILKTEESEGLNWSNHVSKLHTVYSIIAPGATVEEMAEFEQLIGDFYAAYGIIDPDEDLNKQHLTGLHPQEYPIWSDFSLYLAMRVNSMDIPKDEIQKAMILKKVDRMESIKLHIETLVRNYGQLVDGHTSVDTSLLDAPIISFRTADLQKLKAEIFNLQMFLAMQISWDNLFQVGARMKTLYEDGKIAFNDIVRSAIVIDESHLMLNAKKPILLQQATTIIRQGRKYFCGVWLASQSIRDFVPQDVSEQGKEELKILFELSEYKLIQRQDANAETALQTIFGNTLSEADIEAIPTFESGEAILVLGAERKVRIQIELTAEEERLFRGGV